jgi:hypothetical protein
MFVPAVVEAAEPDPPMPVKRAAVGASATQCRWYRAGNRRGRSSDRHGCETAGDCDVDSRDEGELVIGPSGNVRVLVATKPVDFRKGTDGLAALVRETMRTDPFCGVVTGRCVIPNSLCGSG